MKLSKKALANAFGVLGAAYFLGCYLVAALAPGLYKAIAQTWFHMIDLSNVWKDGPSGFYLGLISFTLVSWVSGLLVATAYNKFVK